MKRIHLFAALAEEYAYLLRTTGAWRRLSRNPFPAFLLHKGDSELFLVETGMGQDRMEKALEWASTFSQLESVIKFGFVGSLCRDLTVGSIVFGSRFLTSDASDDATTGIPVECSIGRELCAFCTDYGVTDARFVTTKRPMKKAPLISRFSEIPTVLDMESAVVARYALSSGADFLCLGAVSDAAGDEIDFDLDAITDSNGVVRIRKVLSAVMREPRLVRSFYSSWKRSSLAARNLGNVLVKLLELHAARSEGSSLWCTSKEGGGG